MSVSQRNDFKIVCPKLFVLLQSEYRNGMHIECSPASQTVSILEKLESYQSYFMDFMVTNSHFYFLTVKSNLSDPTCWNTAGCRGCLLGVECGV